MTLKTSCFNRTIFVKALRRFWPLWTAYLVIWLMSLPLSLYSNLQWERILEPVQMQRSILEQVIPTVVFSFFAAPMAALAAFSHLYQDRSCGVYASLPVSRSSMFISSALAGIVPLLCANVVVFAATIGVEAALGALEWTAALSWLGAASLSLVAFYGFAVLCAQLTGHMLVMPLVYGVLNFTALGIQAVIYYFMQLLLFGFLEGGLSASWLTPLIMLIRRVGYEPASFFTTAEGYKDVLTVHLYGWGTLGIYAAAGAACMAVSLPLFRRRRMESAGDVVAILPLRPVFKYCLAFGCALILGIIGTGLFYQNNTVLGLSVPVGMYLFLLGGGFVGFFAAEMLNRKTFRVFAEGWKGFTVFALALALGVCILAFDLTGYERRVPSARRVEYVSLFVSGRGGRSVATEDPADVLELHKKIVSLQEAIEATENADGPYDYNTCSVQLYYDLKGGGVLNRSYYIPIIEETQELADALEDYFNSPAARAEKGFTQKELTPDWFNYCTIYGGVMEDIALSKTEAWDFYTNYLLPDMQEGKISRFWLHDESPYAQEEYRCYIDLSIQDPRSTEYSYRSESYENLHLTVCTDSTRVLQWLSDRGVTPMLQNQDELDEKYGVTTSFPEGSFSVIGGADGPSSIIVVP